MCLILVAYQSSQKHRLIVAANRDEFYGRPSDSAKFWHDAPDVLAGRDLEAGGTWLGVDRQGRFAAVTNFRKSPADVGKTRSRGELAQNFLADDWRAIDYYETIAPHRHEYRGFNLLLMDQTGLYYGSNEQSTLTALAEGCYGLSNQRLNCDWPKVTEGQAKLQSLSMADDLTPEPLLELLRDQGDGRPYSNSFIESADYGTCVSTAVLITQEGRITFKEQGFKASGIPSEANEFSYEAMVSV
jgi:uncharacterized protein with NRDE domain